MITARILYEKIGVVKEILREFRRSLKARNITTQKEQDQANQDLLQCIEQTLNINFPDIQPHEISILEIKDKFMISLLGTTFYIPKTLTKYV